MPRKLEESHLAHEVWYCYWSARFSNATIKIGADKLDNSCSQDTIKVGAGHDQSGMMALVKWARDSVCG